VLGDGFGKVSVLIIEIRNNAPRKRWIILTVIAFVLAIAALIAFLQLSASAVEKTKSTDSSSEQTTPSSTTPISLPSPETTPAKCRLRREWRTLTASEQSNYITSVKCLTTIPSNQHLSSLYEDFPWIHAHIGYFTHNSAPFLPWHRYFLHIYEIALREKCNYMGTLVYWDWTLDWDHLQNATVFNGDKKSGFGTDGEAGGEITVGKTGRCVVDGAFKDIKPNYYDVKWKPHCLSRGFRTDNGDLGFMDGRAISPESIDEILKLDKYEDFVKLMESKVHDTIPFGIGGDFETFTAPYGKFDS
jgi:tyrosinase